MFAPIALLTTYEAFPEVFSDNQFNIPDIFDADYNIIGQGNGIPDILDEAVWGTMVWTNLQYTHNEPPGAVAWGVNAAGYPDWGIPYDQDTLLYGTETNNVDSCSLGAGLFLHLARLIKPYDPQFSTNLQLRGDAAYNYAASVPGWSIKPTHKLYYAIQKYLLTGDVTASNLVQSLYSSTSAYPGSYNKEQGGWLTDGNCWMTSFFMSYILATNRPTNPTVVAYFKNQLKAAADNQVNWTTNGAYPTGWPANVDPYSQYNWQHGPFTVGGQLAYPCLMEWALTRQQKYIDAVSQLMDYAQGLNPIGKCFMSGIGFDQVHNPEAGESVYAEYTMGWGGPMPGITVYGPGANNNANGIPVQIPRALSLPRERQWVDDLGSYPWNEFTICQSKVFPAAIYPVLAQGGRWHPANGEPYLNPTVAIQPVGNGFTLQFGGLLGRSYYLQVASTPTGPWSDLSGPVRADASGTLHFIDSTTPAQTARFYRTRGTEPIY